MTHHQGGGRKMSQKRIAKSHPGTSSILLQCFDPIPGGEGPPPDFSLAIPKQLEISSSYVVCLFLNIHCAHSGKKMPGQIGSGPQIGFVDTTSEKFAITPEVDFFFFHGAISSLPLFIRMPVCAICISQNLYICDLRSCQIRDTYITSLWENIEMRPASSK